MIPGSYSRVLEIGCAEGNFIAQLHKADESWGIESDPHSVMVASKLLTKMITGRYDQVVEKIPEGYFDLVICNDVIEHMVDHDWFFDSIRQKMTPSGRIVLSVPNVRYIRHLYRLMVHRDWQYQDSLTLDRTHLRFFTRKSLRRTLREHGFVIEAFRGINSATNFSSQAILFLLDILTLGHSSDVKYLQFAVRARKG